MKKCIVMLFLLYSVEAAANDDAAVIANLLAATFDKPNAKVTTHPVAVAGDHAVADWTQGGHGGRALLARNGDRWKIVSCGGRALADKSHLVAAGVPEKQASELVSQLVEAEAGMSPDKIRLFDSFQGERSH